MAVPALVTILRQFHAGAFQDLIDKKEELSLCRIELVPVGRQEIAENFQIYGRRGETGHTHHGLPGFHRAVVRQLLPDRFHKLLHLLLGRAPFDARVALNSILSRSE